jgi:diguanylate cyclase (GGDEF)-like protein
LGEYLQACRTPEEAYSILSRKAPCLLPGLTGAVAITSNSRTLVETVAVWGAGDSVATAFHPDECWGLRRGRPHHAGDDSDAVCGHVAPTTAGHVCVPMAVHGETLGVLSLCTDRPGGLTERQRQAARVMADQVSLALANLRFQEALRDLSIRDALTGLYNRRYLEESLSREIARASRQQQPLAVVMMDVDHFKRLNDAQGHEAGDAVLAEVGKLLARRTRAEDIACRFGGEEFCLILPGIDGPTALRRADDLRRAVARLDVRYGQVPLGPVTMSAGVAVYSGQGGESVIAAADAALYRAKRSGRDRVMAADEPLPAEDGEGDPPSARRVDDEAGDGSPKYGLEYGRDGLECCHCHHGQVGRDEAV